MWLLNGLISPPGEDKRSTFRIRREKGAEEKSPETLKYSTLYKSVTDSDFALRERYYALVVLCIWHQN